MEVKFSTSVDPQNPVSNWLRNRRLFVYRRDPENPQRKDDVTGAKPDVSWVFHLVFFGCSRVFHGVSSFCCSKPAWFFLSLGPQINTGI